MTNYHNLNNLIWIWNGQSPDYIVPAEKYDIASIDIYLRNETDFGSHSAQHQWLENITGGKKMLAVSECGDIPNVNAMVRDNSIWSFYGLWYGSYLMDSDDAFSEAYNPYTDWYNMYNSEKAITLYNYINRS
jgi:mannan endo-1,4-beta-mannosidase